MLVDDRGADADEEQAAEDFRTLAGDGAANADQHDADSDHHEGRPGRWRRQPRRSGLRRTPGRRRPRGRRCWSARPVRASIQNEWLCGRSSTSLGTMRKPTHIMRAPSPVREREGDPVIPLARVRCRRRADQPAEQGRDRLDSAEGVAPVRSASRQLGRCSAEPLAMAAANASADIANAIATTESGSWRLPSARRKRSARLLAGMSTRRSNASPARSASALTSARRRTPRAGFYSGAGRRRKRSCPAPWARRRRDRSRTERAPRPARDGARRRPSAQRRSPIRRCAACRAVQGVEATERLGPARRGTSSISGGRTLPSAAVREAIDISAVASASVGCQSQSERTAAKCSACWPLPLAISSTAAGPGRSAPAREDGRLVAVGGRAERHLFFLIATPCRRGARPCKSCQYRGIAALSKVERNAFARRRDRADRRRRSRCARGVGRDARADVAGRADGVRRRRAGRGRGRPRRLPVGRDPRSRHAANERARRGAAPSTGHGQGPADPHRRVGRLQAAARRLRRVRLLVAKADRGSSTRPLPRASDGVPRRIGRTGPATPE